MTALCLDQTASLRIPVLTYGKGGSRVGSEYSIAWPPAGCRTLKLRRQGAFSWISVEDGRSTFWGLIGVSLDIFLKNASALNCVVRYLGHSPGGISSVQARDCLECISTTYQDRIPISSVLLVSAADVRVD